MPFTLRVRYLVVSLVILVAGAAEWLRGYSPLIVSLGVAAFLAAGNFMVYRSGAPERAARRKQKLDYWTN